MTTARWVQFWIMLVGGALQLAWSSWVSATRGIVGSGYILALGVLLFCAYVWTEKARASWGCHTCGQIDEGTFLWLARRRSIRHEVEAHGFSVYAAPQDMSTAEWARRHPQDA